MEVLKDTLGSDIEFEIPFSVTTDTDPIETGSLTDIQGEKACEPTEVFWPIPGNED